MPSVRPNESRSQYMSRCVSYVMGEAGTSGPAHAVAKCSGMWRQHLKRKQVSNARRRNALRMDPTRTTLLRQRFVRAMDKGFNDLKKAVIQLVEKEDAFGLAAKRHDPRSLVVHTRYQALTTPQQLEAFKQWVQTQVDQGILKGVDTGAKNWLEQYIQEAYEKGTGRSFDDYMAKYKDYYGKPAEFYQGTKEEFLRSSFRRPASVERVQLLASRAYTDLKGVTEAMSTRMNRVLTDSIIQGRSPRDTARALVKEVESIGRNRARTIARTETIRAHADGQLEALKNLGVEEVGVMVEWSTASDDLVCDLCADMDGAVLRIQDAGILIPRHPNCLPGDSLVSARSRITAVSERYYEGDLVVLQTASGCVLSCTPNHPILTNLGWMPAQSLDVGSQVVRDDGCQRKRVDDHENEQVPSRIQEVASAFRKSSGVTSAEVPLSSPDFHGDASDGQVAVVWANSRLLSDVQSTVLQPSSQNLLVSGDVEDGIGFTSERYQRPFSEASLTPHNGLMGSCGLMDPLVSRHAIPAEPIRVADTSEINTRLEEDTPHDSTPNAVCGCDPGLRDAGEVFLHQDFIEWSLCNLSVLPTFDEIVSVSRRRYKGHVYNLQTESEWYVAEGIITHNCRCAWLPANVGEDPKRKVWYGKDEKGAAKWQDLTQKRGADAKAAIDKSIKDEIPKGQIGKRTLDEQKEISKWVGADREKLLEPLKSPLDGPILPPPTAVGLSIAPVPEVSPTVPIPTVPTLPENPIVPAPITEAERLAKLTPQERLAERKVLLVRYMEDASVLKKADIEKVIVEFDKAVSQITERIPAINGKFNEVYLEVKKGKVFSSSAGHNCMGTYNESTKELRMASSLKVGGSAKPKFKAWGVGNDMQSVSRHEYGHHFHKAMMNMEGRIRFSKLVKEELKLLEKAAKPVVSQYAKTNVAEMFAESFSAYTHPNYSGGLPAAMEKFFSEIGQYLK